MQRQGQKPSISRDKSDVREDLRKKREAGGGWLLPASIVLVVALLAPIVYVLSTRLGLGQWFVEQPEFLNQKPLIPSSSLEVVAELPMPPGNLAVSSKGRIFFNFHPEYGPNDIKIAELKGKSNYIPFSNAEFQNKIVTCLSMRVDQQDRLWILDYGNHGIKGRPTLYAFDLKNRDKLVKEHTFPPSVAGFGSMLNDFQVDPSGEFIYLVDTSIVSGTPALVVFNIEGDYSYRILESHTSMFGVSTFLNISGHTAIKFGPVGLKINVDSVALDRSGSNLFYGALTGDKLYSVPTSHLLHYVRAANESSVGQEKMELKMPYTVQLLSSHKPVTDGITTDGAGNIWMTALEHSAIAVAIPILVGSNSMKKQTEETTKELYQVYKVVQDEALLRWPDGLCFTRDALYISNSALHIKFTQQDYRQHAPYHILKLSTKALVTALKGVSQAEGVTIPFSLPAVAGH